MSETAKAPATLGPNQIKWCRDHIPAFDLAWRSVQAAEAHRAKVYERMGVEPGSIGVPSETAADLARPSPRCGEGGRLTG